MMKPVNDLMPQPLVQTHKTYGAITGLIIVVMSAVIYVAHLSGISWIQWVMYAIFLGGLVLNAQAFSKANNGAVTFGQVFGSGFKATAIITILVVAWTVLSVYIFPDMKERALELARAEMEKDGKLDDEMIEKSLQMARSSFTTFLVMGSLFAYLIIGLIFSLIAAATAPKNKIPVSSVS